MDKELLSRSFFLIDYFEIKRLIVVASASIRVIIPKTMCPVIAFLKDSPPK